MSVHELLADLGAASISLWVDAHGGLRYRAPKGVMTPAMARRVADHKEAVVRFLKAAVEPQSGARSIPPVPREAHMPVSFTQYRLWVTQQVDPASTAYNVPIRLRLTGDLDVGALTRAFEQTVARHEVLRTVFVEVDGEPRAMIRPPHPWSLPVVDVRGDAAPHAALDRRLAQEARTPFSLVTGPLMRTLLIRDGEHSHVLALTLHHIVIDADAAATLVEEVLAFYRAAVTGEDARLPELTVQYADYAAWQRGRLDSDLFADQLAYWRGQLAGAPGQLPLPTDYPRRPDSPARGVLYSFEIAAHTQQRLHEVCREGAYTPFMVLLAAYQVLLARYCNTTDLCVGVPITGKAHLHLENLIGCFLNGLALRANLADNPSTAELLERVRRTTLEAFDHQDVPFDMVVDALGVAREPGRQPLVQVGFTYGETLDIKKAVRAAAGGRLGGLEVEYVPLAETEAKYDLILGFSETGAALEGTIEYRADLFAPGTIAQLADRYAVLLDAMLAEPHRPVSRIALQSEDEARRLLGLDARGVERILPLSPPQRDIWLAHVRDPGGTENCLGWAAHFEVAIDFERYRAAVEKVAARYSALRTRLHDCHAPFAEPAYQVVFAAGVLPVEVERLRVAHGDEAAVRALIEPRVYRPLDLAHDNLVRFGLIELGESAAVAFIAAHHLVLDGQALAELMDRICAEYQEAIPSNAADVEPDVYPAYLTGPANAFDGAAALAFWRGRARACESLALACRTQEDGPAVMVDAACTAERVVPATHMDEVRALCRKAGVTPALYWKVIYAMTLGLYADARADFLIHEVIAGRPKGHATAIGSYFCQVPFVVPHELYAAAGDVEALLRHAADDRRERAEHQYLSLFAQGSFLPEAPLRWLYNFYNFPPSHALGGVSGTPLHFPPPVGNQVALVVKTLGDGTRLSLQHRSGVLDGGAFLERMLTCSLAIAGAAGRIRPEVFLTADERARLRQWESGPRRHPGAASVAEWLVRGLRAHADRVAVIQGPRRLRCAELDAQSARFANGLRAAGATPGQPVAVWMAPGPELLIAIHGAVRAGVPYIPLDRDYPPDHVAHILQDSGCRLLVCGPGAAVPGGWDGQVRGVDDLLAAGADGDPAPLAMPTPDSLLYVVYTSGSTGRPKGAGVTHAGAVNLLEWYSDALAIGPDDRALLASSIGFDLTQKNLFAVPAAGAALVIPTGGVPLGSELVAAVAGGVTLINCAPSVFYSAVESDADLADLASLRAVVLGGEPIQVGRLARWSDRAAGRCRVINSYGPTECTDVVSAFDLGEPRGWGGETPPIGRPLPNVALVLVDRAWRRVPPGFAGELAIGGVCVGSGYWRNEELTAQRFLPNPFGDGRLYRTGDRAHWSAHGDLCFGGRTDFQVKVRGVRIEPAQIERALRALDGVTDALVTASGDRLVGYVVAPGAQLPPAWRENLRLALPAYMVPDVLVPLAAWPLGANGKTDRGALPAADAPGRTQAALPPRDAVEAALVELFAEVLGVDTVGIEDDFFVLGGHSLLAVQLAARIGRRFDVELAARALFEQPTVSGIAVVIRREQARDELLWRQEDPSMGTAPGYEELAF